MNTDIRSMEAAYSACPHFNTFLAKHPRWRRQVHVNSTSSLKDLRQIQHDIKKEAHTLLDQAQSADRDPTTAEEARLNELKAALDDVSTALDGKVLDMDAEKRLPVRRGSGLSIPHKGSKLFNELLAGRLDSGGFKDLHDFLGVFRGGRHDERMQAAVNQERDSFGSGYLVPSQFIANLLDASLENEIVRPRADIVSMETNEAHAPAWDNQDHSTGSIGGLTGQWLPQGGTATTQAARFRAIQLIAAKLMIYCAASNELVEDAAMFAQKLQTAMTDAIGWNLDYAFLNGTWAGQPRGVLNDPALVTVAKESGQTADTIVYANLAKMFARLHPSCISKSVWVANSTCIPQLLQLFAVNSGGTIGSHVPVLKEDGNGGFSLLTRPCVFTEKVPLLGDAGDLLLVDFSQYVVGLRTVGAIERSAHIGWMQDEENFRLKLRADGKGKWSQAFNPRHGNSQSWCVSLAERA